MGNAPLWTSPVEVDVSYYFDGVPATFDIDNIIKPIADALIGLAYLDDGLMRRVCSERRNAAAGQLISNPSATLLAALSAPGDFVHVLVSLA